ncbi:MAG TPA: glycosyl hydrolase family 28-related protein [Chitinophagaceae bacterium]
MKSKSTILMIGRKLFFSQIIILCNCLSFAQTPESVWAGYVANPYNHANIPNNSYAGYGTGTAAIPSPSYTIYNVTAAPYNAVADDVNDDQPAIQAAIDAAGLAGSGIVYIPAGTYYLNKPLYIKYNNVIVRGQGSTGGTATILDFRFSMYSMFKSDIDAGTVGPGGLWWATGLVWIGPANTFKVNGAPDMVTDYEHWRSTTTLATVTAVSNPGDFTITVNSTASLSAGMRFLLRYQMPADRSLIKEIHGHAATKAGIDNNTYVGDCTNINSPGEQYYFWPAVIQSISGNTITLDRPLRIKLDPVAWPATLRNFDGLITESGVENIQIQGHNVASMGHLVAPTSNVTGGGTSLGGWNGLYINRSWNCWANNIRFVNLECGAIFSAAKNCSVLNSFVTSTGATRWYHHPFAIRVYSSDNLVENFTIDGPGKVYHGINAEWYSSGNVYSKGLMKVGTFDTHRGSPFDLIRTEITVSNDNGSAPGGAATSGPFAGKRFAHWNITQQIQAGYTYQSGTSRNGEDVYEPKQFPMGALVAITGTAENTSDGENVPPGDLGSIKASGPITDVSLVNLYHAELALRIGGTLPIHLIDFTATKTNDAKTLINWVVAEPEDNDRFVLQWCNDGLNFNDINFQDASSAKTNYQYEHAVADWSKNQYYRLKVITASGSFFYSAIKRLKQVADPEGSVSIYPNPATETIVLDINNSVVGKVKLIRIINGTGQTVRHITPSSVIYNRQIMIDVHDLASAHYYIEVVGERGIVKKAFIRQ